MATQNRGTRITKLLGQIKKQFKPVGPPKNRTLVEHLLFACLLENSPHNAAESAFDTLQEQYFDWNEVRVSTKRELSETLKGLVDPDRSAERLKRALHSIFESVYAYDLEPLKKQNLGQAAKLIAKYEGTTPYTVAYVTQNALGGHAIPANSGLLVAFHTFDLISEADVVKSSVPGLERAITKSKGIEVASVLHQLGVEVGKNPYGPAARKLLQAIDASCKSRLPKKPEPPPPKKKAKAKPAAAKAAAKPAAKKAPPAAAKKPAATKSPAKKAAPKKKVGVKKVKKKVKKKVAKKVKKKVKKKVAKKPSKGAAKTKKKKKKTGKKITKRKPK
ncbi:MAG: hypothetical protein ACR2NU_07030 [Aeoliella sp.]